jgi:hypothetical protein
MDSAKLAPACVLVLTGSLLLASATPAKEQPCAAVALSPGRSGICVYSMTNPPAFGTMRVMLDSEPQGKLTRRQPWILIDAETGPHIVGIDLGSRPQARQKTMIDAGRVVYLRHESVRQTQVGFFDASTSMRTQLQEVSDVDAAGDLQQLVLRVK